MKFEKLGLLTLLISLFSIYSCKPDNVGLDVGVDDAIQGTLIDTSTVLTRTVLEDTVLTGNQSSIPLGYMIDPQVGRTSSELALALHLPADTTNLGKLRRNSIIDSAVLVLKYDTISRLTYGDTVNTSYHLDVHQLNQRVTGTNYSNQVWSYNQNLIAGGLNYRPRRNTNVITRLKPTSTPDTLLPHLRIPIGTAFINSTIKAASDANVNNDASFANYFKGLYVRINPSQTTGGPGGYSFFDMSTAGGIQPASTTGAKRAIGSSLVVYFRSGTDTLTSVFSVPGSTTTDHAAAAISHDYSNTPVATQLEASGNSFPTVYVSGLAGVRTKVEFPFLRTLYQRLGEKLVINQAELVVTPLESTVTDVFKAAPRINLYRYDIANQRQPVPDAPGSGDARQKELALFGGYYDVTKKAYRFIVTGYVQDLMSGKTENYGTFISVANPGNTGSVEYLPTVFSPGRIVAGGGSSGIVRMKLNIIYSKLN